MHRKTTSRVTLLPPDLELPGPSGNESASPGRKRVRSSLLLLPLRLLFGSSLQLLVVMSFLGVATWWAWPFAGSLVMDVVWSFLNNWKVAVR